LAQNRFSRDILEIIAQAGDFECNAQEGIAFQIDVEDALGVVHQIQALTHTVEEKI
jgi:hypothetical protein